MKLTLRLQSPTYEDEFSLEDSSVLIMGRGENSGRIIQDKSVSSAHCQIVYENNILEIRDLESKNGTYINGMRIFQSPIFPGDIVKVGKTQFSLISEKSDKEAIELLKQNQIPKNRIYAPMKLDFTSIRRAAEIIMLSQMSINTTHPMGVTQPHRRMTQGEKARFNTHRKMLSSFASTIDFILCLLAIAAPLVVVNMLIILDAYKIVENRMLMTVLFELFTVGLFFYLNFFTGKFTLGQKFVGLDRWND